MRTAHLQELENLTSKSYCCIKENENVHSYLQMHNMEPPATLSTYFLIFFNLCFFFVNLIEYKILQWYALMNLFPMGKK